MHVLRVQVAGELDQRVRDNEWPQVRWQRTQDHIHQGKPLPQELSTTKGNQKHTVQMIFYNSIHFVR